MTKEFEEDLNKQLNEFRENTNKHLNEIRQTMQDRKEGFNKDIEILKKLANYITVNEKLNKEMGMMIHTCNPIYVESEDWEGHSLRQAWRQKRY
jgi:mevalonate kinase